MYHVGNDHIGTPNIPLTEKTVRTSKVQVFWIHIFIISCKILDNPTISLKGSKGVLEITLCLICTDLVVSFQVHLVLTSVETATEALVKTIKKFPVPNQDLDRTIPSQPNNQNTFNKYFTHPQGTITTPLQQQIDLEANQVQLKLLQAANTGRIPNQHTIALLNMNSFGLTTSTSPSTSTNQ